MAESSPYILLVEPNTVLARTYARALCQAGYTVEVAVEAEGAITAADRQTPQAIILELRLPAHDGVEFLYEFRSYTEWRDVPVVIHTAVTPHALSPVRASLEKDLGVSACLYKPRTTLEQLLQAVRRVVAT